MERAWTSEAESEWKNAVKLKHSWNRAGGSEIYNVMPSQSAIGRTRRAVDKKEICLPRGYRPQQNHRQDLDHEEAYDNLACRKAVAKLRSQVHNRLSPWKTAHETVLRCVKPEQSAKAEDVIHSW